MTETLFTDRCQLRSPEEQDRDGLLELLTSLEVRRHLGGLLTRTATEKRVDRLLAGHCHLPVWAVRLKASDIAGCVGLIEIAPHHNNHDVELSYQFLPRIWGTGLAFECTSAVLKHAFMDLGYMRIVSETQATNQASRRLLQRLGMEEEQVVERFGAKQIIYAISKSESAAME